MSQNPLTEFFIFSLVAGLILIGAEVFVPGGVLGVLGGIALLAAVIVSFAAFSPQVATNITIGILVMVGVIVYLWIRFFPRTPIGRRMTLSRNLPSSADVDAPLKALVGATGIADTDLRPSGFALIREARHDVVSGGEMIAKGARVRVMEVHGNRIVVQETGPETGAAPATAVHN